MEGWQTPPRRRRKLESPDIRRVGPSHHRQSAAVEDSIVISSGCPKLGAVFYAYADDVHSAAFCATGLSTALRLLCRLYQSVFLAVDFC